ncbi:glycoside hydrolase family 92 protein [Pleomassaria siparia CBS 279.74]|uniref:Glycoside hydrolase family 92 protein n=1 Tax=Pleomassaria siparia CBS 279.74 TaxID=1314801 RepID=A0A6G1JRM5_9PLEO|nr:glycoside hydrolase family 92 protein [Pleomassaria siparia CBS 279.74]
MASLTRTTITRSWLIALLSVAAHGKTPSPYDYVDPLIGTINGGHVFPGATLPFGMAKAVADVLEENQGGFSSNDSPIYGFSHLHDSGTGGGASLGNFPIFPHAGCPNDDIKACAYPYHTRATPRVNGSINARPGYFDITLESQVRAEMTVTSHAALYRFTFPEVPTTPNTTLSPLIVLDLFDLQNSRSAANLVVDGASGRITGGGTFAPSFGVGNYTAYFCADFKGAELRDAGVWVNDTPSFEKSLTVAQQNNAGAWVRFKAPPSHNQMLVRVGISFISAAQACSNGNREMPSFGFDMALNASVNAWKEKLEVITIDAGGASDVLLKSFWSGIYRSMISPQDYTGENPLWTSTEPYYDSYYCIWDSFRSIHPLLTLLDPTSQTLMVRSLIDIYRHEGKLPDCRMSFCKGFTQGGSNADVVLVDAYLKNLSAGIDWTTGYEALISDAEVEPADWEVEGRGGLDAWKSINYIPKQADADTRSVSRTVEYAYNDFAIALIAKQLGHEDDYKKYLTRSANWKNVFRANQTAAINGMDTGFTGFLQPRWPNGTWASQDPIRCSPLLNFTSCYLNPSGGEAYEGSLFMYTFFVPQDMASLIQTLGGNEAFVKRLDYLHESGILYMGDEQGFLQVFLYHYAGRPGLSAARSRTYIPSQFNDTIGGIPGNDDSGAMGSFEALTMMGIFPNPGQDVYFITPPFFESVSIVSGQTGKTATITNVNFDAAGKNVYIQRAILNGSPYTKNWLQHSFFMEGGVLELTLGPEESAWGTKPEDGPPSLGPS